MEESTKLKSLIVYDAERNEYTISGHNFDPDKAQQFVTEWQPHLRSGCRFITFNQARVHSASDAQDCRACRDQVRHSSGLQPPPKFTRRTA